MFRLIISIFILVFTLSICESQYSSSYVYDSKSGYYTNNGCYYTRTLYQSPGYWQGGCYRYGESYYVYTQVNYTPYVPPTVIINNPAPVYTPPPKFNVDEAILKIKADQEETKNFIAKLKAAGLSVYDFPPGTFPPQYYPQYGGPYNIQGQYYSYQYPVQGSTLYGYGVKDVASLYGTTDLNQLYLQASQLAQGSQRLTSEATKGFQDLVGQAGENQAKIAEINAKGHVVVALIKAMEGSSSAKYSGYSFKVSPGGVVEKMENGVDPKLKGDLQKQLANLVGERCASCHAGPKVKGGFDITGYLDLNPQQKRIVWDRLTTDDSSKWMPRNADGSPGKKLSTEEMKLFFLN